MSSTKRYWQDLSELDTAGPAANPRAEEFIEPMPLDQVLADGSIAGSTTSRRDFLKFLGFSVGAATLAACEAPVIKSIPYVNKPEEITPGVANWYASTYYDGEDFASVLVKTREGRPIHVTGNPRFGVNRDPRVGKGAVNARVNSSVLSLYDSERLPGPMQVADGNFTQHGWSEADKAIMDGLAKAQVAGKRIVLLTGTVISPSIKAAMEQFRAGQGGASVDHVQYDPVSYSGVAAANQQSFGKWAFPAYDLTKADVVVGIGADFLSNWGSTNENTWQYASPRKPEHATANLPMSRHWQFEARMSMTGGNADRRVPARPSQLAAVVIGLHDAIAGKTGGARAGQAQLDEPIAAAVAQCAEELLAARGKSVVMCGINDTDVQVLVNSINAMLANYGSTIDIASPSPFFRGNDAAMAQLVKDMNAGAVGALLIHGVNPAYSLPNAEEFKAGLQKTALTVSFSSHADETATRCNWITPDHHWLESWGDHMPRNGAFALTQPTIRPLFDTRQWGHSLLKWSGSDSDWRAFVQSVAGQTMPASWEQCLHDGVYTATAPAASEAAAFSADVRSAAARAAESAAGAGEWELELYASEAIGSGQHANNPWLQELPDPITKATWDNYICISPEDLGELTGKSFRELYIGQEHPAHVLKVTVNGIAMELPAVLSPGQAPKTIAVALGYGRGANGERVGRAACLRNADGSVQPVGQNAYPWTSLRNGSVRYEAFGATVEPTGGTYAIALTQTQMTGVDRGSIVKETSFTVWAMNKPEAYNPPHTLAVHADVNNDGQINALDRVPATSIDLWAEHPVAEMGHRWGMSIDLNSCIGCGACITACNSENNIPVVGKDEVRRSREMHWLRIDRYYSSDTDKGTEGLSWPKKLAGMERPSASPSVLFIPMMCQHCNHAPCETVCPVVATTHSEEGLNMMTYNRCIGTRYCANNCPYKVRRFNWFNYVTEDFAQVNPAWDELGRMVLNPDVVVRSRGVMEKCTMCVQRIQEGKLEAKKEGRAVRDGDIETACSAACGFGAITFGDINDEGSQVRAGRDNPRGYEMLEEVGTQPNVNYLVKVRNTSDDDHYQA